MKLLETSLYSENTGASCASVLVLALVLALVLVSFSSPSCAAVTLSSTSSASAATLNALPVMVAFNIQGCSPSLHAIANMRWKRKTKKAAAPVGAAVVKRTLDPLTSQLGNECQSP
jgi:hypothetical protein